MRNTDKVKFVGFSNGGKGTTGYKVRFAVDQVRRSKVLQKIGATDITWFPLPKDMTKAEAVQYLSNHAKSEAPLQAQVYQDAIARAAARLISQTSSAKTSKRSK